MNGSIRKLTIRGIVSATLLFAAPHIVAAQEKPAFPPEVVAVLGEPDAPDDGLDAAVVGALGQPEKPIPASEAAIDALAAAISVKLRCPVCQGVAVSDSPSGMAVKMRGQIRDLVAQGYSEEQVMSYFERSYGEFVRLEPPMQGLNILLWVLPALVLLGGGWFVVHKARQPTATTAVSPADAPPAPAATAAVDPALAKYLERIRRDAGTS
jgi:cytochrome c-type biogenesis protein CcmH